MLMLLAMPFNIAATCIAAILKRIAAMLPLLHHCGNAAIARGIAAMPFGIAATPQYFPDVNSRNLKLKHLGSKKLLPRWVGPFTIERRIRPIAYRLALLNSMCTVHPVFHVSRLAEYRTDGRC